MDLMSWGKLKSDEQIIKKTQKKKKEGGESRSGIAAEISETEAESGLTAEISVVVAVHELRR